MAKKQTQTMSVGGRWGVVIVVLIFLGIFSLMSAFIIGLFVSTEDIETPGNVAHIIISGPILAYSAGGLFSDDVADSTSIIEMIEKADKNEEIVAILLEINSPGGTAVASQEIVEAVKRTNKTTVAWIREVGASGAYWVASAADHVIANPLSITGSIGVIGSYIEWGGTLNKYNASYRRLVAGDYKDIGSPFRSMTEDEEEKMQENLDLMRDYFSSDVANSRGLDKEDVDNLEAMFYTGVQAKDLGLVDALGGKKEALEYIEQKHGIEAELAEYRKPGTLADLFGMSVGEQSYYVGQGIGKAFVDAKVRTGVEVLT